eukprot:2570305-Amphidinium_carterae.2
MTKALVYDLLLLRTLMSMNHFSQRASLLLKVFERAHTERSCFYGLHHVLIPKVRQKWQDDHGPNGHLLELHAIVVLAGLRGSHPGLGVRCRK